VDTKTEELARLVEEIRERVKARYSGAGPAGASPADLMPLLEARDAAEGKVAAIGSVNPRPPGLVNSIVQRIKRLISRLLDWHVREQIEFNRATLACVQATLDALGEVNRAITALGAAVDPAAESWKSWFRAAEEKITAQEIQYLRNLADLQRGFEHRTAQLAANLDARANQLEASFRDLVKAQHGDFTGQLDRAALAFRQEHEEALRRVRAQTESIIHSELRVLRQRALVAPPGARAIAPAAGPAWDGVDWLRFSEQFRGSEEDIRGRMRRYAGLFAGCAPVLDLGCGRGELLEALGEAGISARGVELSAELAAICRAKSLDATHADLFDHLASLPDNSLGGIACIQVVEHLKRPLLPELAALAFRKLRRGGVLAIETPNPECLAIFATHFYLDPTHRHPLPAALLAFFLTEAGFTRIDVDYLAPAAEAFPELAALPEPLQRRFFGGLDYAIAARKPDV
jgi:SAM-dependent methyltransferase